MSSAGSPQGFPSISQPIADKNNLITRPWLQLFIAFWNRTGGASGGNTVPTGTVMDFAGPEENIPDGWLKCGQNVSRATYSVLFGIIGTTWGAGDGSTTFALPPQAVFSKGVGADNIGDTGGASTVAIGVANLPAHSHTITDPGHVHTITDPGHHHAALVASSTNTAGAAVGAAVAGNTADATTGITINAATTGIVATNNTGSGTPIPTLPPYAVFLRIIKV